MYKRLKRIVPTGIYLSTLTNVRFLKKILKSDHEGMVIVAWDLGQSASGISVSPKMFGFLMSLRILNGLQFH